MVTLCFLVTSLKALQLLNNGLFWCFFCLKKKNSWRGKIYLAICIFHSSYVFISRWLMLMVTEKKVVILLLALHQTGTNCSSWYGNITFPLRKETFNCFQTLKTTPEIPFCLSRFSCCFLRLFVLLWVLPFFCNTEQLIILVYVNSKVHRASKSDRINFGREIPWGCWRQSHHTLKFLSCWWRRAGRVFLEAFIAWKL